MHRTIAWLEVGHEVLVQNETRSLHVCLPLYCFVERYLTVDVFGLVDPDLDGIELSVNLIEVRPVDRLVLHLGAI